MNAQELTTWNRLCALDLDADAALPFSTRLARDNGWSPAFAAQAIDEYWKFCFLARHAGHPVTPSDEVDQVWHLHLLYSQHYWETLCRDTLEMPLHHGPTRGGADEGRKYHDWYESTLASYRGYFGEPPRDLWPAAAERFHAHHDFVRVDRRDVVTVDRRLLRRGAIATLAGGGVLAATHALAQAEGGGSSGVGALLVGLVVAAVVVGLVFAAARGSAAHRRSRRRATGAKRSAAAGAAGACGYLAGAGSSSSKHPNGDNDGGGNGCGAASDSGADGGGASGCGAGSGCGGGGCGGS